MAVHRPIKYRTEMKPNPYRVGTIILLPDNEVGVVAVSLVMLMYFLREGGRLRIIGHSWNRKTNIIWPYAILFVGKERIICYNDNWGDTTSRKVRCKAIIVKEEDE
jgi:hypothetical protein